MIERGCEKTGQQQRRQKQGIYVMPFSVLEFISKYSLTVRALKSIQNDIQMEWESFTEKIDGVLHLIVHRLFIHSHLLANAQFQWSEFYCKF